MSGDEGGVGLNHQWTSSLRTVVAVLSLHEDQKKRKKEKKRSHSAPRDN